MAFAFQRRPLEGRPGAVLGLWLALAAAGAAAPPSRSAAGEEATAVASVERLLTAARDARADLLAPRQFESAEREVGAARDLAARGAKPEDIEKRLTRAADAIALAMTTAEKTRDVLGVALAAGDAALAAGADSLAAETYTAGERDFHDAATKAAGDDMDAARIKAADAERRFRAAELAAIDGAVLGEARARLAEAEKAGAAAWAPESLTRARDEIARAEDLLATDRSRRSEAESKAAAATVWAARAGAIAAGAQAAGREKGAYETFVLAVAAEFEAIGSALGQDPDLGADPRAGLAAASTEIQSGIAALHGEREAIARDLSRAREEIAALGARERGLSAELAVQREREERFRRVRELFSPEDAVLGREGGNLVLRLKGVRFAEGDDVILPASYPLLAQVMRALRELPGAALAIEGHTDSKGDEKKNLALSAARAAAVRTYLETNMDLSDRLVTTVGRGEAAPIATNDTEAGRGQNRRIDLILDVRTLLGE